MPPANNQQGSEAADTLHLSRSNGGIYLQALGGDDSIYTGGGNDSIEAGAGNDFVLCNEGVQDASCTVHGGDGNDNLAARNGSMQLFGDAGDDVLYLDEGGSGDSTLDGGDGADTVISSYGNAVLYGGSGADKLKGGFGNDALYGNRPGGAPDSSANTLIDLNGNNSFHPGSRWDLMSGGSGNDHYWVDSLNQTVSDTGGEDSITVSVDFYPVPSNIEHVEYAPGVRPLPYWVHVLTPEEAPGFLHDTGSAHTYQYHFASKAAGYFDSEQTYGFTVFTDAQKVAARAALAYIETITDLHFVETDNPYQKDVITFSNNTQPDTSGYAYYPSSSFIGDDVFIDNSEVSQENMNPADGTDAAHTLIHEIGHALGLRHPFESSGEPAPWLTGSEENSAWSMMSYHVLPQNMHLRYSPFDIATLQYLYGPSRQDQHDSRYVLQAEHNNMIWDGGGNDTIDGSQLSQRLHLHLQDGFWDYIGNQNQQFSAAGQVTINIGSVIENAIGGSANDEISGNAQANRIEGGAGNDILSGLQGNDTLDGGNDIDTAVFAGKRSDFTVSKTDTGFVVQDNKGDGGADTLSNIERLRFDDSYLNFDTAGTSGQVYRLYQAAFDRVPDAGGLGFWFHSMENQGANLQQVASGFMDSAEFKAMYGSNPTATSQVTLFYQHVLHRQPEKSGFDYWVKVVQDGNPVAGVLASFAESAENQAQVIGAIRNGIEFSVFHG